MRKLTANTFVTADGVMQAPGAPDEDRSGGFSYGGWIANYWDDKMQEILAAWMRRPFDLLLGRTTYEIFAETGAAIRLGTVEPSKQELDRREKVGRES